MLDRLAVSSGTSAPVDRDVAPSHSSLPLLVDRQRLQMTAVKTMKMAVLMNAPLDVHRWQMVSNTPMQPGLMSNRGTIEATRLLATSFSATVVCSSLG